MKNRYKGQCHTCATFVAAGEGEFDGGYVFCSESVYKQDAPESMRVFFNAWGFSCLNEFNRLTGSTFADRFAVCDVTEAEAKANAPTAEEAAAIRVEMETLNKLARAARRAELRQLKQSNICPRCMGAGGSDSWIHTGWTCNRCQGSGKY